MYSYDRYGDINKFITNANELKMMIHQKLYI